ncbi:uncharacterized protein LOC114744336 [Neltuma alba]|uniref:uncharacterized protein LOC114744336 n=1 Tax=Neltuma alba TaxID=207710 RepID=UPI0010A4B0BC|nr:uncharacterized protein LOC114744336 [Prosopis alba]
MAGDAASSAAAIKCADILVDKVTKELQYLCCYERYTADFERKKKDLSAAVESVDVRISEAKRRNETQIDPIVNRWVEKANDLIKPATRPKKWFGFCNDWFSQCLLAKELESMTKEMAEMMEKAENFSQVAHVAERPGMEFYSQEFMHFKSRNSVFEQLREELKDDNNYRIGLQAMGGSGKTTMAKAVGKEFENSKAFDKVIFIEVPNPVDEKKIRDEIAKKLELKLENDKDLTEQIWIQIADAGNVLIILDDVWEELKLENIGIHHGIRTQGRCCVLLTTRYETVCRRMSCQKTIKLGVLLEEDAVNLFLHHATESGKDCPNKLKLLASKVVNECGNLPVIVVAVARTFRNWDPNEWEDAFAAIEKDSSLRHGNNDEEAKKFYNSLKISFKCLDTRAQDLILICSLFPRAYEIPIELLSRIAIGLGLSENVGSYYKARSEVLSIKTTLVRSALLLTAKEGCVKMHDVIRDVVQHIGDAKIQVIMDSKSKLKENIKYSSWMIDDFFNSFESDNLEVLLAWVNANRSLEAPDTFFGGMEGLRVLLLYSEVEFGRKLHLSLPKSVHSLENIQTLSLANWELGDISILQNLKKLQTLELTNCSISELPNEVSQLEKLRLLGFIDCSIEKNNPFEVIGRCSKLEALYYVSNHDTLKINPKPSKIIDLHQEFGIYHVEGNYSFQRSFQLDASIKRYFSSTNLEGILSESTIKSLVARAEILELTECNEARWANLIPDMVHPKENDGMNDLLRLSLESWPAIQCLINTSGIQSNATIFSNLVELRLYNMHVRELCHGHPPNDFLKQLEKLDLNDCGELDGTLLKGKLELSNLKSIALNACSMTCLFHLSAAQSLRQLENLHIEGCSKLKCLISDDVKSIEQEVDDHQDPNQKIHHLMFPKLKFFKVEECHALKFIFPIFPCKELESVIVDGCNELRYIFGQCLEEGGMYQIEKEIILPLLQEIYIANVPKFVNIYPEHYLPQPSQVQKSWDPLCCLSSKASALSIDEPSFFKGNQLGHTQALKEKHLGRADGLFTPPLYPYKNLRKMSIEGFSGLKSLLTLSIASSLKLLEELTISECGEMEHIVTDEGHVYNHMNDCYIFSNLKELEVFNAEKLKYVFGKCHSNQWHNVHIELNLLNLKSLCLHDVPNMVSICTKNYSVKALSLQDIDLENCPQLLINTIMDLSVEAPKREDLSKKMEKGKKEFTCLYLTKTSKEKHVPSTAQGYFPLPLYQSNLRKIEITGFSKLTSLFTISIASSLKFLETLYVKWCDMLEHIITDEGANSQGHLNVHSIFPNLQQIHVWSCNNLEYVFPAFYSKDFRELGSVSIQKAEKMKYVFRECHADQNHNVQSKLNLPALKTVYLVDLPNMVSICTENYYVEVLHLEYIRIEGCLQLAQTFIDFLVGGHKRQEDISRRKALSFKEKGKALSNLQELPDLSDIYVGSKNSLSFRNLSGLTLVGCKQLKFILSASTTRSIPELRSLFISDCEELVSMIEDDEENQKHPLDLHQPCFPKLCRIRAKHCKKLKCLFSISTCAKLPCLLLLEIEDAPELAQVFEWKQSAPQELVIKDVLPNLLALRLVELPSLHTIYHGIDFQTVKIRIVQDCNNIPSTNVGSSEISNYVNYSLTQEKRNFEDDHDFVYTCHIIYSWADEVSARLLLILVEIQ